MSKGELLVPEHLRALDEHNPEHCPSNHFSGCPQHTGEYQRQSRNGRCQYSPAAANSESCPQACLIHSPTSSSAQACPCPGEPTHRGTSEEFGRKRCGFCFLQSQSKTHKTGVKSKSKSFSKTNSQPNRCCNFICFSSDYKISSHLPLLKV